MYNIEFWRKLYTISCMLLVCCESPRPIIRSGAVDAAVFLASEHDSCDLFLLGQKNWQT